jgi:hypothetical protein
MEDHGVHELTPRLLQGELFLNHRLVLVTAPLIWPLLDPTNADSPTLLSTKLSPKVPFRFFIYTSL